MLTWKSHPLHSTVGDFRGEGFSHVLLRIRIPADQINRYYKRYLRRRIIKRESIKEHRNVRSGIGTLNYRWCELVLQNIEAWEKVLVQRKRLEFYVILSFIYFILFFYIYYIFIFYIYLSYFLYFVYLSSLVDKMY